MSFTYHFQVDATLVSNEFIDRYLAEANGEYVKVYLYLLRHKDESVSLERVADGLNHTEADMQPGSSLLGEAGGLKHRRPSSTAAGSGDERRPGEAGREAGNTSKADGGHRAGSGSSFGGRDKRPSAGIQPGSGEPSAGRRGVLRASCTLPSAI